MYGTFYLISKLNYGVFISLILAISITIILLTLVIYKFKDRAMFFPDCKNYIVISNGRWVTFGKELSGYFIRHPTSKSVIMFSHGNGGNLTWYTKITDTLARYTNVLIYDYPGYGYSTGTPSEESVMNSGLEAYDYISSLGYEKIYCYGFSMGGAVSVNIASKRKVDGLVLQSTFSRISDCIPIPIINRLVAGNNFNTKDSMYKARCPTVIAHSKNDEVIPYTSSRELYRHVSAEKWFFDINTFGHNDITIDIGYYNFLFVTAFRGIKES